MILAANRIIPPKEWQHKPALRDDYGMTVAMYLARNGIYPPKYWITCD